jgi:hypothetical protein
MNQSIKENENEIKRIKEQKLVEESDNKLSEDLFSNNPHVIDKTYAINKQDSINIVKLGKNKFVSVIKPIIIEEKTIKPVTVKPVTKLKNKCYDLNDYDYDFDYSDFE